MEMKSKITGKRDIDWSRVIVLTELRVEPKVLEMHRERINTIFKNFTESQRNEQLNNIVIRDNLFNKAMDYLVQDYDFDLDPDEVKQFEEGIIKTFGEDRRPYANEIAKKIIEKNLIFEDLQKEYNITITDDELTKILQDYYQQTNQPIRDFMQNEESFQRAKQTLLEEKTTAFVIDKFPRDISVLEKKIYESLSQAQAREEAAAREKKAKEAAEKGEPIPEDKSDDNWFSNKK